MKIVVDRGRCIGNGVCESYLPAVFELDDDGAVVIRDEAAGAADPDVLRRAVTGCPSAALSLDG